jgi:hypothetical protein
MVPNEAGGILAVFSRLLGQGSAAGLVREGDDQQANGEGNRGESDGRSERAHSGHSTGETEIHAAPMKRPIAEGEGGCARFSAEQLRQPQAENRKVEYAEEEQHRHES